MQHGQLSVGILPVVLWWYSFAYARTGDCGGPTARCTSLYVVVDGAGAFSACARPSTTRGIRLPLVSNRANRDAPLSELGRLVVIRVAHFAPPAVVKDRQAGGVRFLAKRVNCGK